MKRFILFLILSVFVTCAFAQEEKNNDETDKNDEKTVQTVPAPPKKLIRRAEVRPKREQKKTIQMTNESLSKFKQEFYSRKTKELELLRDEKSILEYYP